MPASWLIGSGDVLVDVKAGNGVLKPLTSRDPPRIGPYQLRGELGAGGFGRVFLGESADGQRAAVKVIHSHLAGDHEFRVRFRREVAAARRVSGRFTARLIDADVDGPEPWLATEYVHGPSLKERVALRGPMAADSVLDLVAGLAQALAAIHAASLVHRDLNPKNVLLAKDGPRVIDFGIARAAGASSLTATGNVIGTLAFMSPEQALGHTAGPPSDVFSLGSVLVFAATGQGPFGTGSGAELLYRVAHTMPDLDRVPAELRPLAARCLARDPARRPAPGELLAYLGDARSAPSSSPRQPPALSEVSSGQAGMVATRTATSLPGDSPTDWPEAPARQSIPARPGKARPSFGTAKPRSRLWPLLAGLGIILIAGIVAGVILTGQPSIQLAAGTMLWSANTGPYIAAPAVANGAVYVGGANGKVSELTEIDRSTGKRLWTHAVSGGPIDAAPTVKDGIVYASDNSSVYAFDANDGRLRWVSSPGGTLDGTPTFADGTVFVSSFENTVYAIDATDGSIRWRYAAGAALITTGSLTQPSVTVADGIVYVGAYNGNVYALNATNGDRIWTRYIGAIIESTPAVAHGLVYVTDEYDSHIYALDTATGSIRWQRAMGSPVSTDGQNSSPVVAGGTVYVGGFDGNIYAFDAATGRTRWTYSTGYAIDSTPVVMEHTLYTGCSGGLIYALNIRNGKPRWSFTASGDVDSDVFVSGNIVYADSWDSSDSNTTLFAVKSP